MSLRARLIVAMAVVGVVLVISAVVITTTTESHLLGKLDDRLQEVSVRQHDPGPRRGPVDDGPFSSFYIGYVDASGNVVLRARQVSKEGYQPDPELPVDSIAALEPGEHAFYSVGSDGGPRYRVLAVRPPDGDPALVVGTERNDVDDAIRRLITVEVAATIAIVAVLALVTFWVIRLGVRPIKRMTATASGIAAGDLSERVPEAPTGTEAGELGVALNQMLGRIEAAFDERTRSEQRLRRFVGDASHELRTPVTTIRGYAELYRSGGLADDAELREAMRRTEQEAVRMGTLVDDLLLLARLDQGRPLEQVTVRLEVLAHDAVRDARAVDPTRPIAATVKHPAEVIGDDSRLRQVVANLVRNALVHTPEGTPVEVMVDRVDGRAILQVHDEGPGMSEEVAAQAFERFYRADPSRVRSRGGTGLGLAIVQATVRAHGGDVSLETAPGGGTTVRIDLPATP
jgi:two-component system, OmpR family, sensor kinase